MSLSRRLEFAVRWGALSPEQRREVAELIGQLHAAAAAAGPRRWWVVLREPVYA